MPHSDQIPNYVKDLQDTTLASLRVSPALQRWICGNCAPFSLGFDWGMRFFKAFGSGYDVSICYRGFELKGELHQPRSAPGLIIVCDDPTGKMGSERSLAEGLRQSGWGTLRCDLMLADEGVFASRKRRMPFDLPILADRLIAVADWAIDSERPERIGIVASGDSAAGALIAAHRLGGAVGAVVCCGGAPETAGDALESLKTPVLFLISAEAPEHSAESGGGVVNTPFETRRVPGLSSREQSDPELVCLISQWFSSRLLAEASFG